MLELRFIYMTDLYKTLQMHLFKQGLFKKWMTYKDSINFLVFNKSSQAKGKFTGSSKANYFEC
jgi:hypothetical protein